MTTWKQDHASELIERQQHISQKLAQLERIRTTLGELATRIPQMRTWLATLARDPDGGVKSPVEMFNPEIFIRMGSIAVFIRTVFGSLLGAGGGNGEATSPGAGDSGQAGFAGQAAGVLDAAGPLGTQVPLGSFVDQFGITDTLESDGVGWTILGELWATITSPFETYQRHKFTHMALDAYSELLENHGDDLKGMASDLGEALAALQGVLNALNIAGVQHEKSPLGGGAEADLREALRLMEETYDDAGGTGPSAGELRDLAAEPPEFVDIMIDPVGPVDGSTGWAEESGFNPPPESDFPIFVP